MEQKIENAIDYALENFAPLFYRSSIIIGILLILLGLLLFFRKSSKKKLKTVSLISIGIGIFAIASGIIQLKF